MIINNNYAQYVNYVSSVLDRKIKEQKMPSPFGKSEDKVGSLQSLCGRVILQNCELNNLNTYPDKIQLTILSEAKTFKEWTSAAVLCSPSVVEEHAKGILKALNQDYNLWNRIRGISAKEKLLNHTFTQLIHTSNLEEIEALAQEQHKVGLKVQVAASRISQIAQSAFDKLARFFNHSSVRLVLGGVAAYWTWRGAKAVFSHISTHYIPYIVNPMINHVPVSVIRVATVVYDYRWALIIITSVGSLLSRNHSFPKRIFDKALFVLWLPTRVAWFPFNVAITAFKQSIFISSYTSELLKKGGKGLEIRRLTTDLEAAQKSWARLADQVAVVA